MKINTKNFLSVLLIAMLIIIKPSTAFAKTIEQDNLKVNLSVEKVEANNKDVKVRIKLENSGIRNIENININNVIPDGFTLKEGHALTKEVGTLKARESSEYEFYCEVDELTVSEENKENAPSDDGSNKTTEKPKKDFANGVKSGDYNNVLMLAGLAVVSGIIFIVLLKKNKRRFKNIISIFICFTLLSSIVGSNSLMVKADEVQKKEISVSEDITINNKKYTVKTIVNYKNNETVVKPSGKVITRGEWISKLVNVIGLKNNQELKLDESESIFKDIENTQYKEDIIYAKMYNIIDNKDNKFYPNEPATREFASTTSVKALGFEPAQEIMCDDSNEITYLKEIETAVSMKLISLESNKFYPTRSLTEAESQYILIGIQAVLKSTEIDKNHKNVIEYKDEVVEFKEDTKYEINESTCTLELNDETKGLKKDDIFVIPNEKPFKVNDIKIENNKVNISISEVKVEEVLDYIDIQGEATVKASEFIPAEGVNVVEADSSKKRFSSEGEVDINVGLNLEFERKLSEEIKINGEVKLSLPKIEYMADVSFTKMTVNNAFIEVPVKADIKASITKTFDEASEDELAGGAIYLGKIPVPLCTGVNADFIVELKYSVEGEFSIEYSLDSKFNVQVINNRPRKMSSIESSLEFPSVNVKAKIGPQLKCVLTVLNEGLIDLAVEAGGEANGELKKHNDNLTCIDVNAFVYANLSAFKESLIGKWIKKVQIQWEIFNKDNSKWKYNLHFENYVLIPECTYGSVTFDNNIDDYSNLVAINEYDKDINKDAIKDKIVLYGKSNSSDNGSTGSLVVIFDGKSNKPLTSFKVSSGCGKNIKDVADVTGDGINDIIIETEGVKGSNSEDFIYEKGKYKPIIIPEDYLPVTTLLDDYMSKITIEKFNLESIEPLHQEAMVWLQQRNAYTEDGKLTEPDRKLSILSIDNYFDDVDNDGKAEYTKWISYRYLEDDTYSWLLVEASYKYDKNSKEFKPFKILTLA